MAKCAPCDCPSVLPPWLGTFGDLMSLLLTFFILLLSMASFDAKPLTEAEGSMRGALSMLPGGVKTEPGKNRTQTQAEMIPEPETAAEVKRVESLYVELQQMLQVSDGTSDITSDGEEGFVMRLPAGLLFEPGQTNIKDQDGMQFIRRLAMIARNYPPNIYVEARGHVDSDPLPPDSAYDDKWTLSAMRALSVSKIIKQHGFPAERILTLGRGDQEPMSRSRDARSKAENDRVDVYFYPKRLDEGLSPEKVINKNVLQSPSR